MVIHLFEKHKKLKFFTAKLIQIKEGGVFKRAIKKNGSITAKLPELFLLDMADIRPDVCGGDFIVFVVLIHFAGGFYRPADPPVGSGHPLHIITLLPAAQNPYRLSIKRPFPGFRVQIDAVMLS